MTRHTGRRQESNLSLNSPAKAAVNLDDWNSSCPLRCEFGGLLTPECRSGRPHSGFLSLSRVQCLNRADKHRAESCSVELPDQRIPRLSKISRKVKRVDVVEPAQIDPRRFLHSAKIWNPNEVAWLCTDGELAANLLRTAMWLRGQESCGDPVFVDSKDQDVVRDGSTVSNQKPSIEPDVSCLRLRHSEG